MNPSLALSRLDWRPLRWAAYAVIAVLLALNALLVADMLRWMAYGSSGRDFYATFVPVLVASNPYDVASYLWSPLAVPILGLLVPFGFAAWTALHALALLFIRPWWMALAVGLSWPFWFDTASGNVTTFVLIAALAAVRGSRIGMVAFCVLALLMPRPLMLPVLASLLWTQPWLRIPFIVAAVAQIGIVAGIGLLDDWTLRLFGTAGGERLVEANIGPSKWLGYPVWAASFVPLAIWLTIKGRYGLASLAISPYLFPSYLMMAFLELRPEQRSRRERLALQRRGMTDIPSSG